MMMMGFFDILLSPVFYVYCLHPLKQLGVTISFMYTCPKKEKKKEAPKTLEFSQDHPPSEGWTWDPSADGLTRKPTVVLSPGL